VIKRIKIQPDLRGLILIVVAVAWMTGILLDSWLLLPSRALLIGAAIALACVILFWRNSTWMLVSLVTLWLLLGAWRFAIASPASDPHAINAFIGAGKIELRGTVADEPKLLNRSSLLLVAVSSTSANTGLSWQDAHGQLEVQMPGTSIDNPYGPNYGDNVEIQGKVQPPFPHHSPEVFASMALPRLTVIGSGGNPIIAALFHLRLALASLITQLLPQPMAALLIAILLSLQTPAMKPLTQTFINTGTVHLIAPSGFKVTILAGLVAGSTSWIYKRRDKQLKPLLPAQKRKGYWRRWLATSLVILCIIAYSILSGAGPAAQRACIMGIILVLAPRFGRIYNIYTAMALAVLIMSMFDSFVLWNAGFQLSTLGTLGIVVLTPLFQRLFHPFERLPFAVLLTETVAVTLSAQIATLPILAFTFSQVSFIAPLANLLTVPLLAALILSGIVLCIAGSIALPLGILCGWIIFPLLKYTIIVVGWCASRPYAFQTVGNFDISLVWVYYLALILILSIALRRKPEQGQPHAVHAAHSLLAPTIQMNHVLIENKPREVKTAPSLLPPRILPVLRYAAAMLVILAAGATIAAAPANEQLSIILLNVGPAGKPAQGEVMLIHTVDGKTILIDGGLDATSLAQELDSRLPFWQRSIDTVILTSPRQDHLIGSQDIISRFQVREVLDAGMVHPNAAYTLWRHTISDRNLPYSQVREGSSIPLGTQVTLQVLWPPAPLHKGADEELDNALIMRLAAPHFSMLLLGVAALSNYALSGLLTTIDRSYLRADVVQVVGEAGKAFPAELSTVLQFAHPSLITITPAALSLKLRKAGTTSTILPPQFVDGPWQVIQTAQAGTIEISSSTSGWDVKAE
jgi:competence protein ComEC